MAFYLKLSWADIGRYFLIACAAFVVQFVVFYWLSGRVVMLPVR
jgi:hypothetical protein